MYASTQAVVDAELFTPCDGGTVVSVNPFGASKEYIMITASAIAWLGDDKRCARCTVVKNKLPYGTGCRLIPLSHSHCCALEVLVDGSSQQNLRMVSLPFLYMCPKGVHVRLL